MIRLAKARATRRGANLSQLYTRRIVTASDNEPAYRIIQRLRVARLGLAAVLDQEKKIRGIVAIEDLIRRLVSSSEARV
jgi:CBS domain containing-hemolysin-like protein